MKIVTVNVPERYISAIEQLIGDGGLYPSRSELIRCAVREFLLKELKKVKDLAKYQSVPELEDFDDENFVRVPVEKTEGKEPVREFKTYKILRKLEH
ncbi:MAG: ribbon-helix-helix protein, CopG family [Promethearchaeota archaeon]|nr:MAG: ribbon-helix-helix protein, CopG family [Candidatus Lokiarchaeota archaeon]